MKIIGWTEWDDPNHKEMFRDGGSYKAEDVDEAIKVISEELRKNGYKFSGIYHQNGDFGVPIFDNGEVFQCSQRMWGSIMAKAYPNEVHNSDGYGYVDWAWMSPEPMVLPIAREGD